MRNDEVNAMQNLDWGPKPRTRINIEFTNFAYGK